MIDVVLLRRRSSASYISVMKKWCSLIVCLLWTRLTAELCGKMSAPIQPRIEQYQHSRFQNELISLHQRARYGVLRMIPGASEAANNTLTELQCVLGRAEATLGLKAHLFLKGESSMQLPCTHRRCCWLSLTIIRQLRTLWPLYQTWYGTETWQ